MSPDWILDSAANGAFLPEQKYYIYNNYINRYGKRYNSQCFLGKDFYLAKSFIKENEKLPFKPSSCQTLIVQLGHGRIVESVAEAEFVIVGQHDKEVYPGKRVLAWNQLLDIMCFINVYYLRYDSWHFRTRDRKKGSF